MQCQSCGIVGNRTVKSCGSAIIPADRAVVTSYRLSIVTMSPSIVVWLKFSEKSFKL